MSFYGAVLGALVKVRCDRCGTLQVRGNGPRERKLFCKSCRALLPHDLQHAIVPIGRRTR